MEEKKNRKLRMKELNLEQLEIGARKELILQIKKPENCSEERSVSKLGGMSTGL